MGYFLSKRGVNIGYISIGVDWAQVVAIFADAGVQWPPVVRQLLHILSAFNLCAPGGGAPLPGARLVASPATPRTPAGTSRSSPPSASCRPSPSSRSSRP